MNTSKVSITFTGADGETRGSDVCLIAECARECGVDVEMAILWSANSGRERYPTGTMARSLWNRIEGEGLRSAVHVCGVAADRLLHPSAEGVSHDLGRIAVSDEDSRLWIKTIRDVAAGDGRVQINVRAGEPSPLTRQLDAVRDGIQQFSLSATGVDTPRLVVIGQHRGGPAVCACDSADDYMGSSYNTYACPKHGERHGWPAPTHGVAWLYDASGGRGVPLDAWPDLPDYPVGLAGGLGPSYSAAEAARRLATRAGGWVDMESRIRTDGRLDPALCCRVIREVAEAIS